MGPQEGVPECTEDGCLGEHPAELRRHLSPECLPPRGVASGQAGTSRSFCCTTAAPAEAGFLLSHRTGAGPRPHAHRCSEAQARLGSSRGFLHLSVHT